MPSVSVIIPCYNASRYIRETVESVVAQEEVDVEIIAIDDKSEDDTWTLLEQLSQEHPGKLRIVAGPGKGPAAARNVGIDIAEGEFLAFLDADDVWFSEKLKKQFARISLEVEPGLVYSDRLWIDADGNTDPSSERQSSFPEGRVFEKMIEGNYVVTSSVLVPRDAVIRVSGFDESDDFMNCQDYHLWLKLAEFLPFYAVKEPLIKYRIHTANRHKNLVPRYRGMVACLSYARDSLFWGVNDRKPYEQLIGNRLATLHSSYARQFFRRGDFKDARQAAKAALSSGFRSWRLIAIAGLTFLPAPLLKPILAFR